jgi:Protein kinase domain
MVCPACARENADDNRFCSGCGGVLVSDTAQTLTDVSPPVRRPLPAQAQPSTPPASVRTPEPSRSAPPRHKSIPSSSALTSSSPSSSEGARFVPGTVLAERYRIVALAGRGGMGEVYRADDLKLGQAVALKFIPEAVAQDGAALARFHREVRIARQVSHASVCRVFDIGEIDGAPFLTMEYVDGEDLGSLMRRIGRLSADKAMEIARQICAGLAAAHDHGILHRDLKPTNIMLDGRGKARITDFGLAGLADELREEDPRAGTPAYMSPEQLAGKEVTQRSDIYSLGLVLYELFTGKRAFEAATLRDLIRQREQGTLTSPSSVVKDLDPVVERVILRCLEKDPAKRPATALQVAAALPGGDPLAAALAAGETPSPEMVAAAGEGEVLRPQIAWAGLAGFLVLLLVTIVLNQKIKLFRDVPFEKPPEVLEERAREVNRHLGYTAAPADHARGFLTDLEFLRYIRIHDQSPNRWSNLENGEVEFWYRESPRPLEAAAFFGESEVAGSVSWRDPPQDVSGMTTVWLSPRGKLLEFEAVPPQLQDSAAAAEPDWKLLFTEAGLDPANWKPSEPEWNPPEFADRRAAWTGTFPAHPEWPLRIEAAAYHGKPIFFYITGPWTRPWRQQAFQWSTAQRAANVILLVMLLGLMIGGAVCARYNLLRGRGDRRGASRLAAFFFLFRTLSWLFGASHVAGFWELALFILFAARALFDAGLLWLMYIALEPFVRRQWPAAIVSWSRLLAGGWRDPLVGRDVLVGCLAAVVFALFGSFGSLMPQWLGHAPQQPDFFSADLLLGTPTVLAVLFRQVAVQVFFALSIMFVMLFLRWVLRLGWLAGAALVVLMSAVLVLQNELTWYAVPLALVMWTLVVFVLLRFGLVAISVVLITDVLIDSYPITTDASAWYAGAGYFAAGLAIALAVFGFRIALAGKPMFGAAGPSEAQG